MAEGALLVGGAQGGGPCSPLRAPPARSPALRTVPEQGVLGRKVVRRAARGRPSAAAARTPRPRGPLSHSQPRARGRPLLPSQRTKFTLLIRTRLISDFPFLLLVLGWWWLGRPVILLPRLSAGWLSNRRIFLLWPENCCLWANPGFWKFLLGQRRGASHVTRSCVWAASVLAPGRPGGSPAASRCCLLCLSPPSPRPSQVPLVWPAAGTAAGIRVARSGQARCLARPREE